MSSSKSKTSRIQLLNHDNITPIGKMQPLSSPVSVLKNDDDVLARDSDNATEDLVLVRQKSMLDVSSDALPGAVVSPWKTKNDKLLNSMYKSKTQNNHDFKKKRHVK